METFDKVTKLAPIDGEYESLTYALAQAKQDGLVVVTANEKVLFLDIDTEEDLDWCKSQLRILNRIAIIEDVKFSRSKSNNWHIYVKLKHPLSYTERLCLQSALGSDRKRDLLSWLRCRTEGKPRDIIFFELPDSELKPFDFTEE
jgi:hypothetical protein